MTPEEIKEIRTQLDSLAEAVTIFRQTPEVTLSWRALQMSKGWLGKLLEFGGTPSPYSVVEKAKDIPPTADTGEARELPDDRLAAMNQLRDEIGALTERLSEHVSRARHILTHNKDWQVYAALLNAWKYCAEARMWLGFELQNIKAGATS